MRSFSLFSLATTDFRALLALPMWSLVPGSGEEAVESPSSDLPVFGEEDLCMCVFMWRFSLLACVQA